MTETKRIHGGNLTKAKNKYQRESFLDFSANINPLGPPPKVLAALKEELAGLLANYPDPDCQKVKGSLARYLQVPEEKILVGNGASELIFLFMKEIAPRQVFIPVPTFSEYEHAGIAAKSIIKYIPLSGQAFSQLDRTFLSDVKRGDLLVICNPNNPTGQLFSPDVLRELIEKSSAQGYYVLLDESFMDFVEERENHSYVAKLDKHLQLFILYSLTKFFALPGLRLGVIMGQEEILKKLELAKDPWNVNSLAQLAGIVALEDKEYIDHTFTYLTEAKKKFYAKLKEIPGIYPFYPQANYIFCKLTANTTATELVNYLGKRGILIRNCNSYPLLGESYIRIAVKSREYNEVLLEALREWSKERGNQDD